MRVTVLGCGGSVAVPAIHDGWGVCDPEEPRNRRRRSSILIESDPQGQGTRLLVDAGPDLHGQLIDLADRRLDACLITHAHSDHCHGLDELRTVAILTQRPVKLLARDEVLDELRSKFGYLFAMKLWKSGAPVLEPVAITGDHVEIGDLSLRVWDQDHRVCTSLGLRCGGFAYSTDLWRLTPKGLKNLSDLDCWLVASLQRRPHSTHAYHRRVLGWIEYLGPRRAFLTHMNNSMDYATLCAELPPHIRPAYDRMTLEFAG